MQYPLQEDDRPIVISYESQIPKPLETTVSPKREPDRNIGDSWWSILLITILSFSGLLSSPIFFLKLHCLKLAKYLLAVLFLPQIFLTVIVGTNTHNLTI